MPRLNLLGNCATCPLGPAKPVQGIGSGGSIAVIGESPGHTELAKGKPFVGVSGQLLRSTLAAYDVSPDDVYFTNSVLCHASGKPSKDAIVACNERLLHELDIVQPSKILTVGAAALQALVNPQRAASILAHHGRGYYANILGRDVFTVSTYHPAAVLRDVDLFRDFASDVEKLATHSEPVHVRHETYICWKSTEAIAWLNDLRSASLLSCDVETTGLSIVNDALLSIGFGAQYADSDLSVAVIFPMPVIRELKDKVRELLLDKRIVFHNAKFDLQFLKRELGSLDDIDFEDTMLTNYALDERPMSRYKAHGLKGLARRCLDAEPYSFDFNSEPIDYKELFRYQGLDCVYTLRLFDALRAKLRAAKYGIDFNQLWSVILRPATLALADIETHGVRIDTEYLTKLAETSATRADSLLVSIEDRVCELTHWETFNPASPLQIRRLLYDHWRLPHLIDPADREQLEPTSRLTLERLAEQSDDPVRTSILRDIVTWRQASKMSGTYAGGLLKCVDTDGRIHPSYLLHGTATGRLSCTAPNLQNIPTAHSGSPIPRAFIPDPGMVLLSADYSQLELRVAAWYSRDEKLRDIFLRGADIHSETAEALFGKREISGAERTLTKAVVFGIIYGRGPKALVEGKEMQHLVSLGGKRWTLPQAQTFLRKFLDTYPQLRDWLESQHELAVTKHYVSTPYGRRRRFPLLLPQTKAESLRQAANMPIQSLASDITLRALIRLHKRFINTDGPHPDVLLTIHDSILFQVPSSALGYWTKIITREMTNVEFANAASELATDIPFPITIAIGDNWGDLHNVHQ